MYEPELKKRDISAAISGLYARTDENDTTLPSPEMASEGGTACHVMLQGRLQTRNYPGSPEPCGTNV